MSRCLAVLLALLALVLAAPARAEEGPDEARQVLVMIELPPPHFRVEGAYGGAYADLGQRQARRRLAREVARSHGLVLDSDWPMPMLGVHCFVMTLPPRHDAEQALQSLNADARVAWAQPMHSYLAQQHGDPLYRLQPAAAAWRLDELHTMLTGRGVQVAVIDSGVEAEHPDLAGQVLKQQDFVPQHGASAEQHGTGVAAVIAARADNGVGIVGVAPQARLLALRACWQRPDTSTSCNTLSLAQALQAAIDGEAQVINLSLAGPSDKLLGRLLDVALQRGIAVVGAFDEGLPEGGFPASHPGVLAVVSQRGTPAPAGVLAAPGIDVPTAAVGGRWMLRSGNSFAAAHVSGLVALWREQRGAARMQRSAFVSDARGAIDACATLRATNACACGCRSVRAGGEAAAAVGP